MSHGIANRFTLFSLGIAGATTLAAREDLSESSDSEKNAGGRPTGGRRIRQVSR